MRRGSLRIAFVWMLTLVLVAPSLSICACTASCAMGPKQCGSPATLVETNAPMSCMGGQRGTPSSNPEELGHEKISKCGAISSCGCSCAFTSADATMPAAANGFFLPTLPVPAIREPAQQLFTAVFSLVQPGFFGYDSGPPRASPRLRVQDRSPPMPCAFTVGSIVSTVTCPFSCASEPGIGIPTDSDSFRSFKHV